MAMADEISFSPPELRGESTLADSYRTLTVLAIIAATIAALYFGKDVLLPVTLAVLLSFVLSPVVRLLRKLRVPRVVAVVFSVSLALAMMGGIGALVGTEIVDVARDLPKYEYTIEKKVAQLRSATIERILHLSSRLRGGMAQRSDLSSKVVPRNGGQAPAQQPAPVPVEVQQPPPGVLTIAQQILVPVLSPLLTAAIIFVVAVFILMQQQDLRDRMIRLFGARDLHRTTLAMDDAAKRLSRYFLVQIAVNVTFGALIATGLYFIGLPDPILWGVIAGLLRFVPYIGSYIAAGMPIVLAAAVNPGWSTALWVASLFLVTEPLVGQFIEPMAYGRSTGLSPVAVVIAAIFWTWLWGPVGLILSTPLTLCVVVLGRHVEQLEFLNVLFGDRPALTRAENFYQRILAGDIDEVEDQAEAILNDLPLTSYYDDVVIKALELVAHDAARGILNERQLARIKAAIIELATDLDEYDERHNSNKGAAARGDVRPSGPDLPRDENVTPRRQMSVQSVQPVWTIAAHTQLDEIAAIIMARLLRRQGVQAEVLAKDTVSRAAIAGFDPRNARILCICYIDDLGTGSHLRFLLRRLRQRAPAACLLALIWPSDHPALRDGRLKAGLGADQYTSSLRHAVEACLRIVKDERGGQPGLPVSAQC
jgi:predicted PurR-regulated permease PerM